jgi:hypothetical protein
LESRSFRMVRLGNSIWFCARQSLKVYKRRDNHFPS